MKAANIGTSIDKSSGGILSSIHGTQFLLAFTNDNIEKISFEFGGKSIVVNLYVLDGLYTWNFTIESPNHTDKLVLTHEFNQPFVLSIDDYQNKVGFRFVAKNRDGQFRWLEALGISADNLYAQNKLYRLKYSEDGKRKNKRTKLVLDCISPDGL